MNQFVNLFIFMQFPDSGGDGGFPSPDLEHYELTPSDLRFNEHYVLYYKNIANFLLTMIFPFTLLAFYNFRIISVLRRRRRLTNRPLQQQNTR